jgi:patatin-like phospholipase/acyl hydrolase
MSTFRILSLDGGGIMGAFTASVLATLEEQAAGSPGQVRRILDHFDLVTGTSTGGILAIGLAMGKTARELCHFYETEGPSIFPSGGFLGGWRKGLRHLFQPKYTAEPLRKALASVMGEATMAAAQLPLAIPAYDVNGGRLYVFKTGHHPRFKAEATLRALDVALATSAAPTYFPAHTVEYPGPAPRQIHGTYIDGGVWANCPVMVGLTEALTFLGQNLGDIWVLSVSTTNYPFHIADRKRLAGVLGWNTTIIDTLMFGQAEGPLRYGQNLLGGFVAAGGRLHRIDYCAPEGLFSLDNAAMVEKLVALGNAEGRKEANLKVARDHFLNGIPAASRGPTPGQPNGGSDQGP